MTRLIVFRPFALKVSQPPIRGRFDNGIIVYDSQLLHERHMHSMVVPPGPVGLFMVDDVTQVVECACPRIVHAQHRLQRFHSTIPQSFG